MACDTYSSLSCMDRISTAICGNACLNRAVASMPLMPRILISINTRSTWCARAWASASSAPPASATTSKCATASRRARKPSRTRGWSSTSRMLIVLVMIAYLSVCGWKGEPRQHQGAGRGRSDVQASADGFHAFRHVAQADATLRMQGDAVEVEAAAIILDAQFHRPARLAQAHFHAAGVGMALAVGQRFLGDAKQHGIDHVGQALARRRRASRETGLRAAAVVKFMHQVVERGGQAQVVENGRAQVVRNAPHLAQHLVQLLGGPLERGGRLFF